MTSMIAKALLAIAAVTSLTACARDRSIGLSPQVEVASLTELPPPARATAYTIGAQETLEITVAGADILSGTFLTDDKGYISYPLVGDLYLAGKTPNEISRLIADQLRGEYVVNPQVRVRPASLPSPMVSVGGEVDRPGTYPAATSQSLIRAINNAGGLSDFAKSNDVLILRTVDGQRYIGVYNIEAIQRGNYEDPLVYPNDIITVGDSPWRRTLQTVLQLVPLLSTSAILIDRASSPNN